MSHGTHRANYGYIQWTNGEARRCIRALSDRGCIVQRVDLAGGRPAIRIKPDVASRQFDKATPVRRGEILYAEVPLCGCTVYWEIKEH